MVLYFSAVDNFDFTGKIVDFFWCEKLVKMLWFWNFLAVDNFDFTRKIVKQILGEKLVKIEFLDKNLTFRIVCKP